MRNALLLLCGTFGILSAETPIDGKLNGLVKNVSVQSAAHEINYKHLLASAQRLDEAFGKELGDDEVVKAATELAVSEIIYQESRESMRARLSQMAVLLANAPASDTVRQTQEFMLSTAEQIVKHEGSPELKTAEANLRKAEALVKAKKVRLSRAARHRQ